MLMALLEAILTGLHWSSPKVPDRHQRAFQRLLREGPIWQRLGFGLLLVAGLNLMLFGTFFLLAWTIVGIGRLL